MMLREATPAMWSARKFDPADYEAITPPLEAERAQYVEGGGHGLAVAGPAVTFVNEVGAPIACMGIVLGQEGTGYAWAYVSREARSHPITLTRKLRRLLALAMKRYQLRRVDALVADGFAAGERWATALGFGPTSQVVHINNKELHVYVRS
jgi:hypothetical protein